MNFNKETIRAVNSYTYMNERFMAAAFNKPVAQHILSVILDTDLQILDIKKQLVEDERLHMNCRFDVSAKDNFGKVYNIEFQVCSEGTTPGRVPYYGMVSAGNPETYVIFVTEKDVLGYGLPIYHIESQIKGTGKSINDGQHIIYVNGESTDTSTTLGQLMTDMQQADAFKISDGALANRMNVLKSDVAFETMCSEIDKQVSKIVAGITAEACKS